MSHTLTPKQNLVMWCLLITGAEPKLSEIRPKLKPAERKPLVEAGWIELEKRGRATHIMLTDKAWERALTDFGATLSKTPQATPVLEALLTKLQTYLSEYNIPLAEFLGPQGPSTETILDDGQAPLPDLEERIRTAYLSITKGNYNERVRLSALRSSLSQVPRKDLDQSLRTMQLERKLILMPLDDPQEISAADEQAAINIGGDQNHLVYLKG